MKRTQSPGRTTRSSSSERTALSQARQGVLDLGRALVQELGLDSGVDTLGRWMAHHIAELMREAEAADRKDRPAREDRCASAILALWRHRHQLPDGKRPFEDMEPVLRALESLDPENERTPRYLRAVRAAVEPTAERPQVAEWVKLADSIDEAARILIRYSLCQASGAAADKSRKWVGLAKQAGLESDDDLASVRVILEETHLVGTMSPDAAERTVLADRIRRLQALRGAADTLESHLQRQLGGA